MPTTSTSSEPRIALVSGASRGLGLAIATRFAQDGIGLVLTATQRRRIEAEAEGLRAAGAPQVFVHEVDVRSEASVQALIEAVEQRCGRLDILVNNAGVAPRVNGKKSLVEDTSYSDWSETLAVNLTGAFLMARAAIPLLKRSDAGRIINIGSRAGRTYSKLASAHYAASKAGLIGFSRILAGELGPDGITVNCVCPTRIDTSMSKTVGDPGAIDREFLAETPVGRMGVPADVSSAVAFLASREAGFISGAVLDVTGGQFMP